MSDTLTASRPISIKRIAFVLLALMALFVISQRDIQLLNATSPLRQHYAGVGWLIAIHGTFGTLALLIGPFQFWTWLRRTHPKIHRTMGRLYILGALIAAPIAIPVSAMIDPPELLLASVFQSVAWVGTTLCALYFIRTRRIAQHREWMIRSYPFALVFVFARVFLVLPPIQRLGVVGLDSVVWTCIAMAGFLPSALIAWYNAPGRTRSVQA